MLKKFILTVCCTLSFIGFQPFAQENSSLDVNESTENEFEHGVYLELGGNAGLYSFNYERVLSADKLLVTGRIGLGVFSEGFFVKPADKKGLDISIPFGGNAMYNIGGAHNVEFGLGATLYTGKVYHIEITADNINQQPVSPELVRKWSFWPNFGLGYRFQKPDSKLYYRGFANGHLTRRVLADDANRHSQYSVVTLDPWLGLSIGYTL